MAEKDIYRTGRKWYDWYHPSDTKEERKLIAKLDVLIVSYAFVTYWAKYLDQSNISAYTTFCLQPPDITDMTSTPQIMHTPQACPKT